MRIKRKKALQGNKEDPFFKRLSKATIAYLNQQNLAMNMKSLKENGSKNKLLIEKSKIDYKSFIIVEKSKIK